MSKMSLGLGMILVLAAPGAALAGHGKAGLWSVTSTTDMKMTMPPQVAARMKATPMPPQTHTSRLCMSQEEVDSSSPPHIDEAATGCTTKVTSATASTMTAAMTCNGRLKGTGQMRISYRGAEHYAGSYSFTGTVEGNATDMTTRFKGDWVKADCGTVKPYKLRTQ